MSGRGVLVFDGDCGFCTSSARFVDRRVRPDADVVPWQAADLTALGITAEQARAAVQWVAPDGAVSSGSDAIAAALRSAGAPWPVLGRVLVLPLVSVLARAAYRVVSANRQRLPGATPACSGRDVR